MTSTELRQRDLKTGDFNGTTTITDTGNDDINTKDDTSDDVSEMTCAKLQDSCYGCCYPCLASKHHLPRDPSLIQKFKHAFMLPPHGNVAAYLQFVIVCLQIWIVLYSLTHGEALPGGNLFSLLVLFIACAIGGYVTTFVRLPPLLGMLIMGVLLRNVPGVKFIGENINPKWSTAIRKIALTVILTRAGLGLDVGKLRKLSWAVLRLAFLPCLFEIITSTIVSHFLLGFPWEWSLLLGCILGALSPAVTVPILVNLQDRRYGVDKGIPTMLLAAGGLDNVFCVTGFSVFMGIIFSEGELAVTIFKGPAGALLGVVYGFIMGTVLWYFPSKDSANPVFYRTTMLLGSCLIAIFGSSEIGLSGAGPLGCLTTAVVAAYKWRQRPGGITEISGVLALAWLIVQHFLFGLIGAAVNISNIGSSTAGLGIATLLIGVAVRTIVSSLVTIGTGFNIRERVFVTLTWLAKATVQAAIGGLALDRVMESADPDTDHVKYATDVLTLSVLAIVVCAPIGATLMSIFGPRFLVRGDDPTDDVVDIHIDDQEKPELEIIDDHTTDKQDFETEKQHPTTFKSQLSVTLSLSKGEEQNTLTRDIYSKKAAQATESGFDNPAFDESFEPDPPASNDDLDVQELQIVDEDIKTEIEGLQSNEPLQAAVEELKVDTIDEVVPDSPKEQPMIANTAVDSLEDKDEVTEESEISNIENALQNHDVKYKRVLDISKIGTEVQTTD